MRSTEGKRLQSSVERRESAEVREIDEKLIVYETPEKYGARIARRVVNDTKGLLLESAGSLRRK